MKPKTLPPGYALEAAQEAHVPLLRGIETAATGIFPPGFLPEHILSDHAPRDLLLEAIRADMLPVVLDADRRPVGYGLLRFVDGLVLPAQLDVHPAHGRKGLGTGAHRANRGPRPPARRANPAPDHLHPCALDCAVLRPAGPFRRARKPAAQAIREILAEEHAMGLTDRVAMRLPLTPIP